METKFDKTLEILFELKVTNVMKSDVIVLSPDDDMYKLREVLRNSRISGIPVVKDDKLVGIISIEDLIKWLNEGKKECCIGDVMEKNPEYIYPETSLANAIKKFDKYHYGRFPVFDRNTKKMVGIITKGDIIEGALKKLQLEYKEEEIRQYRASHIFDDIIADNMDITLSFEVAGKDFDNAGKASTTVRKDLKRLGINPDIIHKIAIASYEAEINLVLYTDGGTMDYHITKKKITIDIKDNGPGIENVELAMKSGYTTSSEWVKELGFGAGMGLPNIKKCSDEMEIESTVGVGTKISITIYTENKE